MQNTIPLSPIPVNLRMHMRKTELERGRRVSTPIISPFFKSDLPAVARRYRELSLSVF